MSYTLDQVRCFVAVAEELHFGHAAERLNMTQPPLSRQIQKLEKSLGVVLLDRTNRSVRLTAGGEAFLENAHRLLTLADEAPSAALRAAEGETGLLRLGFTTTSSFDALNAFLALMDRVAPDVTVDMHELVTRDQVRMLQEHQLDLSLGRPSGIPEDIHTLQVLEEDLVLAVPAGHELTRRPLPLDPEDLGGQALIMHSPLTAQYFHHLVTRIAPIREGRVVHQASQVLTILSLVRARRGIAFVPASTQQVHLSGVTYLPLHDTTRTKVELHALWSPTNTNPIMAKLLSHLKQTGLGLMSP
ncbi:LysR family transcriptional regulator [Nesterenkonia massiliensis]|uniref:LysR family transcriptional regulator n=1 Tax=Nesterenkonia massiliensis TaxID=1232429 RepID=UPI00040E3C21|nr:LysR family transcriptional regulator [Nesterenkonia massiliensis]